MTTCEMCGKLATEQFCVRTCYNNVHLSAQKTVYKQIPLRNILNLIYKKIIEITVYLIKYLKNIVEICSGEMNQTLVIKINVSKFHSALRQCIIAQRGFSATPDTYNNLCLSAL